MTHLIKHVTQAADAGLETLDLGISMVRDTVTDVAEDAEIARERTIEVARIAGNEAYEYLTDALADARTAREYRNIKRYHKQPENFEEKVHLRLFRKLAKKGLLPTA